MQFIKSKYFPIVLLFLLSLFALSDLFHAGLPVTHDGQDHLTRIANFYTDLTQGILIPRWAPYLNWGYGHPVMMFLYPFPSYFASIFLFMGISLYTSTALVFGLGFIFSGTAMYLYLKEILNKLAAIVGAVLYMFAPYRFVDLYVRGAIGEHVAFIFLPLILLFLYKTAKSYQPRYAIYGVLSITGLLLSHNAISIMFLPVMILYMIYLLYIGKWRKELFLRFGFILFVGFLLSSFFLLPAFFEGKYTLRDIVTSNEYASRFVTLEGLIYSSWSYGGTGDFSVQIGVLQWISVISSVFLGIKLFTSDKKKAVVIIGWLAVFLLSIFLMLPVSKPIYGFITVLQKFQFPWRFLTISVLCTSVLSAYALFALPKKYQLVATALVVILALLLNSSYWHANGYITKPERFFTHDYPGTTDTGESAPIWSVRFMEHFPKAPMEIISGKGSITQVLRKATNHSYTVTGVTDLKIRENTLYFPGWEVLVDGVASPIEFQDQANRGLITFPVTKGTHTIQVAFHETKFRLISDILSLLAIMILFVYGIGEKKKIWKVFQ